MKTLITPTEVVRYSDIDINVPVCDFRQIQQIESYLFGTKLNSDLYTAMLAALNDYSAVVTWKSADAIVTNDLRTYNGIVYKAKQNSTGVLPTNKDYWGLAKKFNTDCFENLWCDVLANYIAIAIVENRLPKIWVKVKAEGVVKQKGEMYDSANANDFRTYHNSVIRDLEICYFNLVQYMQNTDCLSAYTTCGKPKAENRVQYNVG